MFHQLPADDLDPRRRARHARTRDWASMSRTVAPLARLQDLLATVLVRLGR